MSKNITSKLTRKEIFGMFSEKPCDDAVTWLENQPDIETAWETCERGDWMIWALRHIDNPPDMEFWLKLAIWAKERAEKHADHAGHADHADHAARAAVVAARANLLAISAVGIAAEYANHAILATSAGALVSEYAEEAAFLAICAANYAGAKNEHAPQADWVRENIALPRRK